MMRHKGFDGLSSGRDVGGELAIGRGALSAISGRGFGAGPEGFQQHAETQE